ncbi:MAG TPA: hypothetical protein VHD35_12080 [Chitinophagaceae bacterium]|nr:hypothetical protein [Chitinophagaceae bacterium]
MVLIIDKSGNIRKGNVVLFKPDNVTTNTKVPDNTFHDIFNTGTVSSNGLFQFLSVDGQWKYQLGYKDGSLISFGLIKPKNDSNDVVGRLTTICIDWYLVTTYYYADGSTEQTSEYVGTTCSEDCTDGMYASICPDGSSGGGGWGNDSDFEYAVEAEKSPVYWNDLNSSAKVLGYEFFQGQRNSSEPQGGHFTGVHVEYPQTSHFSDYGMDLQVLLNRMWIWNSTYTAEDDFQGNVVYPPNTIPPLYIHAELEYDFASVFH